MVKRKCTDIEIKESLIRNKMHKSNAARDLGIQPITIYKRIAKNESLKQFIADHESVDGEFIAATMKHSNIKRLNREKVISALKESKGCVLDAARIMDVDSSEIHAAIDDDVKLYREFENLKVHRHKYMIDLAYANTIDGLRNGYAWATKIVLQSLVPEFSTKVQIDGVIESLPRERVVEAINEIDSIRYQGAR